MTEQPTVHQPAVSTWPSRTAWAAYSACALALLSAIPSFYWAAGGTIGLDTVGGAIEELARARDPAGVALGVGAGVLKVAGGVLALALVRPWGRRAPRRLLDGVAWAASVVLTLYGGLQVAVGASVLAGVIRPAGPVDRTALRWHVLLWDLWFLVWGLLLGVAAWHHGRQSRPQNFCPPAWGGPMEQHLPGGLVNAVIRIGDTVRRPPSPNAGFVHDLLAHLEHGLGMDVPPGPLLGLLHQSFLSR